MLVLITLFSKFTGRKLEGRMTELPDINRQGFSKTKLLAMMFLQFTNLHTSNRFDLKKKQQTNKQTKQNKTKQNETRQNKTHFD